MVDANPENAKIVGTLVGEGGNALSKQVSKITNWITDFIGSLGWFEWSIIMSIVGMSLLYVVLKRKVDILKNTSRSQFYGRRKF